MRFTPGSGQRARRVAKLVQALTVGLLLSGCTTVSSLQPPYEEKDIVTQPSFSGTWDQDKGQDKDNCLDQPIEGLNVAEQPESKSFELSSTDHEDSRKGWVTKYDLRLVRLQNLLFVDLVFKSLTVTGAEEIHAYDLPATSTHFFARIWIEGDHVRVAVPDASLLENALENHKAKLQLQKIGEDIILTGSTSEIRDFLLKYPEQVFIDWSKSCGFTRRK